MRLRGWLAGVIHHIVDWLDDVDDVDDDGDVASVEWDSVSWHQALGIKHTPDD